MQTTSGYRILAMLALASCHKMPDGSGPGRRPPVTVKYEFVSNAAISGALLATCHVWWYGPAGWMARSPVTTFPWVHEEVFVPDTSRSPIDLVATLQGGFFDRKPKVTGSVYVNGVRMASVTQDGNATGTGYYWLSGLQVHYEVK